MKVLIIGSGIAALSAAEEIRAQNSEVLVTIITDDYILPYYRMNLIGYIANDTKLENLIIHPKAWFDDRNIILIQGKKVIGIERERKALKLSSGTEINYDKLIIANGSNAFLPPILGNNLTGVVTLRTIKDANEILGKSRSITECVCIGGGILGLEAAAAIARNGVKVTVLEASDHLMPRQLNKNAASLLKERLSQIGVTVRENIKVQEILGSESCTGVKFSTGEIMPSSLVVIAAGVRPNTDLAKDAGLKVEKGIITDDNMCTSDSSIYSAGDVCEHNGTLYGLWSAAMAQGKVAGANAIGVKATFTDIPRANALKVVGLDLFSVGEFTATDASSIEYESKTDNSYLNIVIRGKKAVGGIVMGNMNLALKLKNTVQSGIEIEGKTIEDIISKL